MIFNMILFLVLNNVKTSAPTKAHLDVFLIVVEEMLCTHPDVVKTLDHLREGLPHPIVFCLRQMKTK